MPGRVVERGHGADQADAAAREGGVERVEVDAVRGEGDRHGAQAERGEGGEQAGVGGRFDGHGVTRVAEGADGEREGLRGAAGHDQRVGIGLDADAREPLDQHATQALVAARIAVVEERVALVAQHALDHAPVVVDRIERWIGDQALEPDGIGRGGVVDERQRGRRGRTARQHRGELRRIGWFARLLAGTPGRRAHEGAAADPRLRQPERGQLAVGARDGLAVHAELLGEIADRRQARARRYPPRLHRAPEISDELAVHRRRPRTAFERDDHAREVPRSNDPVKRANRPSLIALIGPAGGPPPRTAAIVRRAHDRRVLALRGSAIVASRPFRGGSMVGITAYGAYIPMLRLPLGAIGGGTPKPGGPEKAVANWDEDAVTMGVAAAIDCLHGHRPRHGRRRALRVDVVPLQGEAGRGDHRQGARSAARRLHRATSATRCAPAPTRCAPRSTR